MAHTTNYAIIFAAPESGLEVLEVARSLGRTTLDVGTLCGDSDVVRNGVVVDAGGKINKWAKHKPVRLPDKTDSLSDADLAGVDYGFDTGAGAGISERGGAAALASLMSAIISNGGASWNYLPPRGMNHPVQGRHEWFRLLDFDGYNRNAKPPFRVASHGTVIDEPVNGYLDSVIRATADVEIDITRMKAFVAPDAESGQMNLACVVRNAGADRIFILDNPDPFSDSDEVFIPINLRDGANYCQFIYTDIDPAEVDASGVIDVEAGEDYNFIALPDCYQVFTVSAIMGAVLMNAGWAIGGNEYFFKVQLQPDGYVGAITPKVAYTNATGEDVYVQAHASFRFREEVVLQSDSVGATAYVDPEDNLIELPSVPAGDFVGGSDFDMSELADLEVKLWWTWGTKSRYFNFATGQVVASDPGYMTISRFFTTQN